MLIIAAIYISFTVTLAAVFLSPLRFLYASGAGMVVLCVAAFRFAGGSAAESIYVVMAVTGATLCIKIAKELASAYTVRAEKSISERKQRYETLISIYKELVSKKRFVDEKSFMLGQIYEATKRMSGMLKTEDVVRQFSVFINERFSFADCYLMVLGIGDEQGQLKRDYKIVKGNTSPEEYDTDTPEEWKTNLIKYVSDKKRRVLENDESDKLREILKTEKSIQRMDIIPLYVENRIIALVCIDALVDDDREPFFILVSQLAMELKKTSLYEQVETLSFIDGLTGIYLRRYFMDRLFEEIKRADRINVQFSVLMIDIDHFKKTNDTYGHMVGDVVLREVAELIRTNVREIDLVARYGGEEFSVLLPYASKDIAYQVSERIRKAIESTTIVAYDETQKVTVSIGISVFPDDSRELAELISNSDKALYDSKRKGRNKVTIFSKKR